MESLGLLDQLIMLAILRQHPSAYGVSIKDEIEGRANRSYSVGAIYAALDRLDEKGLISARKGEPTAERGGRRKLYFTLTAPGQASLQQSLRAVDVLRKGIRWKVAPS